MNEKCQGGKRGLLMWTGKNKRWYLKHRFCFLVVCVCFGLFSFFPREFQSLQFRKAMLQNTQVVLFWQKYIKLSMFCHMKRVFSSKSVQFHNVCRYVYPSDLTSAVAGLGQQHEALQNDVTEHDITLWSDD